MIQELVENFGTSAQYVRNVIWAQRVHFPALVVDWQGIVNDYGDLDKDIPLRLFANYMPSDIVLENLESLLRPAYHHVTFV
jgi:hypothetical protein